MFKRLKLNGFLFSTLLVLLFISLVTVITGMTLYKNVYVFNNLVSSTTEESEQSDQYLFDTFFNVLLYKNSIFNDKNILDLEYSDDKHAFLQILKEEYLPDDELYFDVGVLHDDIYYSLNANTVYNDILVFANYKEPSTTLNVVGKKAINGAYVIVLSVNVENNFFYFFLKEETLSPLFQPTFSTGVNVVVLGEQTLISTNNDMFALTKPASFVNTRNYTIDNIRFVAIKATLNKTSYFAPLVMYSFINYQNVYGSLDIIFLILIVVLLLVFLLMGFISYRNVENVVDPIKKLSQRIKKFKQVDETNVLEVETNEVVELENSFNEMVERIETLLAKQVEDSETKRKLELESLQTQINPHFLYNALDSIAWMSKISHNKNIEEFIILLAKFYRLSLHKGAKYVKIAEEMDIVKFYLSIQAKMFPNLFTYEINLEPALKDAITLKLILQPLVENAIKYAFHSYDVKGKITVSAASEGDKIVFKIIDNGRGFDVKELAIHAKEQRGFGIRNVKERLKLEYDGDAQFAITSTINQGTAITITIPKTF